MEEPSTPITRYVDLMLIQISKTDPSTYVLKRSEALALMTSELEIIEPPPLEAGSQITTKGGNGGSSHSSAGVGGGGGGGGVSFESCYALFLNNYVHDNQAVRMRSSFGAGGGLVSNTRYYDMGSEITGNAFVRTRAYTV